MIKVLTGSNSYALAERLEELKHTFTEKYGEQGVEVLQAEQLKLETLANLVTGTSLFSSNRFLVLKNLSAVKDIAEVFVKLLPDVPETVQIILLEPSIDKRTSFYKTLKQKVDFEEFNELDERTAARWVKETVAQQKGELKSDVAQILVQYVGTDQQRLNNEIEKLLAYSNVIDAKSIALLVDKRPEETIFQLLELALRGKRQQALVALDGLERAHEDPHQIASMLIWQVQILAIIASAEFRSEGEIAKAAKINPFVVKKTRTLARDISRSKLREIVELAANLDVKLKSTSANPWHLLQTVVVRL